MSDFYYLKYRTPIKCKYDITVNPKKWVRDFKEVYKSKPKNRIRRHEINGVAISTVFLGLDHGWGDEVLLFETMIFGIDGGYQTRCTTHRQALKQHRKAIEYVKKRTRNSH